MIIENNEMKNTKLFRFFFGSRLIPVGFWTLFVLSVEHNIQRWEFIKENKRTRTRLRKRPIKTQNKNSTRK